MKIASKKLSKYGSFAASPCFNSTRLVRPARSNLPCAAFNIPSERSIPCTMPAAPDRPRQGNQALPGAKTDLQHRFPSPAASISTPVSLYFFSAAPAMRSYQLLNLSYTILAASLVLNTLLVCDPLLMIFPKIYAVDKLKPSRGCAAPLQHAERTTGHSPRSSAVVLPPSPLELPPEHRRHTGPRWSLQKWGSGYPDRK